MKRTKMLGILVLALGLMVLPASVASGAQYLTVNGQDVTSITLELGQSRTIEVVSTDSTSYTAYLGFDNGVVLGDFSHLETKPEAGNLATVADYNQPTFYGYYLLAAGSAPPPSAGVHFVFQYVAQELGTTDVKLYDGALTSVTDSVQVTVIRPTMGTAFTYQGRLMDDNEVADGIYDFQFKLYDYKSGGSQLGSTIDINDLDVIDGHLAVDLDFGSGIFDGNAVWLETTVAHGDGNDPCTLKPRLELTPTPYALQTRGLFVDNAGNVGIGTTSPGGKLDVAGNINATDYYLLNDNVLVYNSKGSGTFHYGWDVNVKKHSMSTDGVERLVIDHLGNVGIGTTNPLQKLHVADAGMASLVVHETDNNVVGQLQADTKYVSLHSAFNHPLRFKINDITRLFIDTNGNVGIGTTTPRASLEVTNAGSSHAIWASTSDIPVYAHRTGTGGTWPAVHGESDSASNNTSGVRGILNSTTAGSYAAGVYGYNKATNNQGFGVYGKHDGSGAGVYGRCDIYPGKGVYGESSDGYGVYGKHSRGNYGYLGGYNVGVHGSYYTGDNYGFIGGSEYGVYGYSKSDRGVRGEAGSTGTGVYGASTSGTGVYGYSSSGYAGYFNGNVYVEDNVSALSFTDRTPYPKDVATAYEAVMSMERLPDGQYDENNQEAQLNHSMLSDFVRSEDGNRDLSATVSCHNEVLKDLINKQQELGKAHIYIEQLQKQNKALETRLVKLEAIVARLNVSQKGGIK